MDTARVAVLLENLLDRTEMMEDGRATLPGVITSAEIDALKMALSLVGGEPQQPSHHATTDKVSTREPQATSDLTLNLRALTDTPLPSDTRLCMDFGTAMSKAALVRDLDDAASEEIEILNLGIPGNQEHVSDSMLISTVYVDNDGLLWFGHAAYEKSLIEGATGERQRLDNIKRRLSEDGWDEVVSHDFNPTDVEVTYGEMVLAYLTFMTWTVDRCLDELGYQMLLPRRFALPCFEGAKRRESINRLRSAIGGAQILSDTFGADLIKGIPIARFVGAAHMLEGHESTFSFVDEDVTEPLAIAGSMVSWRQDVNHLVLVIDVGAGTTDIGLYRLRIDVKKGIYDAREVADSNRVLTEAGDHIDKLLVGFILKKGGVSLETASGRSVLGRLNLRIREFKETLFDDHQLVVPLDGHDGRSEVEIGLSEFCELEAVKRFGASVREAITDMLQSVDDSWIGWIRAHPRRALLMMLAGGGAQLPMIRVLAEQPITVHGKPVPVQRTRNVPGWLGELDEQVGLYYPRVAVSLGGARKHLIREQVAKVTAGDVTSPPKIGGYYQKSGPR